MKRLLRVIPFVIKQITRSPVRSGLTLSGIAVAMYLFVMVEAMRDGVQAATEVEAEDATLVVYRENRFCPFTSRLPQFYGDRISELEGVRDVIPLQVLVSNCRASLDVVTFRGVPRDDLESALDPQTEVVTGSTEDWLSRGDGAMVGSRIASKRGIGVGDRFSAAGVTVYVAGIIESDHAQDRNAVWVHLPFLQETIRKGGTGSIVTQFNVMVDDPTRLEEVASSIDEAFAHDEHPTATRPEKAFVGQAASDIVELVEFGGILAWGALAAVFALIANAIVMAMRDRIRDHAVLQTLGYTGRLIGWMVVIEGTAIGLAGGLIGALAAWATVTLGQFSLTMEGINIEIASGWIAPLVGISAAVVLGLLAGIVPAIRLARHDIASSFRAA